MAESVREETLSNCSNNTENVLNFECAVCLQTCMHPAELPCGHIFCYLCIKGIINQGRRCAMCRQSIPLDYLEKPRLLKPVDAEITSQGFEDGHLWFYEGHNGWWQYDDRTSLELESAYQKGERCCDLLIAGFLYIADFDGMLQYRKNDPSRKRRIKRDLATTAKKGIAGLKATKNCSLASSNSLESLLNGTIQNLPVSNSSNFNNFSSFRPFTSSSGNSAHQVEFLDHQRIGESSPSCLLTYRPTNTSNCNVMSPTDNAMLNPRNINLDSVLHDTLDWTIEQIESLNLELLNDYETLFRDVNNYGQLEGNLNQRRFRRASCNYMSRFLNVSNPESELVENLVNSTDRLSHFSQGSNNLNSPLSEISPIPSQESDPIYSEVNAVELEGSSLEAHILSTPPLPPPRNRGVLRARFRMNSSQDFLSSNCETLSQNSGFNK